MSDRGGHVKKAGALGSHAKRVVGVSHGINSLISLCLAVFAEVSKGKFVDFVVPGNV